MKPKGVPKGLRAVLVGLRRSQRVLRGFRGFQETFRRVLWVLGSLMWIKINLMGL